MNNCLPEVPPRQLRLAFRRTVSQQLASHAIHARYSRAPWTSKGCAICGEPRYQLHHLSYDRTDVDELLLVIALCKAHHQDFSLNLWPHARGHLTREHATLLYIIHGGRLHQHWCDEPGRLRIGVSPNQEVLAI